MSASRISPLPEPWPSDVADELAAMMPPGVPPLALFRTLARSPRILRKIRVSNLLDRGPLERRERELVILRTCARCRSEYEWGVHAAVFARRFGLSDAEIAGSLRAGWRDALWSDRDRLLIRLVDELHEQATVSDALWSLLRPVWSDEQLIELIVLAGFYHTISFVTNALTIPLEDSAERFPAC
jgi:4-carboxymuconolactone decarboxylase